jgi:hypothetical protein
MKHYCLSKSEVDIAANKTNYHMHCNPASLFFRIEWEDLKNRGLGSCFIEFHAKL